LVVKHTGGLYGTFSIAQIHNKNADPKGYPMANLLYDALFGRHAGKQTPFLYLPNGQIITHAGFLAVTARYAHAFGACGLNPGDRVAVQVEKSSDALALYAACVQAGLIFLPLNPAYRTSEVAYFVGDSGARLVVCDPKDVNALGPVAAQAKARLETMDNTGQGSLRALAAQQAATYPTVPRKADDLAAFLYTSGTTGRSKGAMLSQNNLLSNAQTLVDYWQFTDRDVLLHALPIFHTHGLFVASNVMLVSSGPMIFKPNLDVDQLNQFLPSATALKGVPKI
jgi:malonyl-CoA/methylmalonyl-CoA synthetase